MSYLTHFNISDFCITKDAVPQKIADAILLYHIIPLNIVQDCLPFKIYPSYSVKGHPSGYRPYKYEISKGRSGKSQHTFGETKNGFTENHKGALDLTCEDFTLNKNNLLDALINYTDYKRLAVYNSFIHCDYKDTHDGKRLLFKSNSASNWSFVKFI